VPPALVADRYPYRPSGKPQAAVPGMLVKVQVSGFSTYEEQENALRQFMDKHGIARPGPMMLDAEFFNPLFMSSVCRGMARTGKKVLPRGLHATRDMFNFVLNVKCEAFGTEHDGKPGLPKVLRAALNSLAGEMVANQTDHVPFARALRLLQCQFEAFPLTGKTWIEVLEGADILRRDIDATRTDGSDWELPNEVIRFTFQRLQDNLMAEHLSDVAGDIDNAFAAGGPWAFLVRRKWNAQGYNVNHISPAWTGLMGSLWAQVAEKFGRELWDLPSLFITADDHYWPNQMRDVFRISVRERRPDAFSPATDQLLADLWDKYWTGQLEIYLGFACVPGHPWNADHLAQKLAAMPPGLLGPKWLNEADPEVLRLGLTISGWLAKVLNPSIRAGAERVLTRFDGAA
jgi:hypothetical protein